MKSLDLVNAEIAQLEELKCLARSFGMRMNSRGAARLRDLRLLRDHLHTPAGAALAAQAEKKVAQEKADALAEKERARARASEALKNPKGPQTHGPASLEQILGTGFIKS